MSQSKPSVPEHDDEENGMIENTSKRDPLLHLAMAWGDADGYITGMEAQGQREVVNSDRIPTDCRDSDDDLRALGFVLGEPDPADPMFRPCTLPDGWTRAGTDHAMHSSLLDAKGRKRAGIFYKAAFYDRRASMSLTTVHGYISELLHVYEDRPIELPQLDDEWCTAEAVMAALRKMRERTGETRTLYSTPKPHIDPQRAAERLAEVDAEEAKQDQMAKAVSGHTL